jgi:hypothetical protein
MSSNRYGTRSSTASKPSKRKTAPSEVDEKAFLQTHLDEIQKLVNVNLKPQQISDRLHVKFGVLIDPKTISNKIASWKKNGRISIPPSSDTRAEDALPLPPKRCFFFFPFFSFQFLIFKGQGMAAGINSVYTNRLEKEVEEDLEEDVDTQLQEIDVALFERLHGSGLLFSKVTTKSWVLVFSNTPHFEINVEVHSENQISIVFSGEKPSVESLKATQDVTGVRPDEWGFEESGQLKCSYTSCSCSIGH